MADQTTADALEITSDLNQPPIAEIGIDCNFPNTSHFIKLFKKEYGMTPAAYRTHLISGGEPVNETVAKEEEQPTAPLGQQIGTHTHAIPL